MAAAVRERIASTGPQSPGRRVGAYLLIAAALLVGYAALSDVEWQGTAQLHTVMEVVATVLALFVGVLALLRYYSFKRGGLFFVGVAFIGTGLLDGYHAVVTSESFSP